MLVTVDRKAMKWGVLRFGEKFDAGFKDVVLCEQVDAVLHHVIRQCVG